MSESLFCSMAQTKYESIVTLIETGITVPVVALRALKSYMYGFNNLVLLVVEKELVILENKLLSLLSLYGSGIDKTRSDFCEVAYACQAVRELLFPASGSGDDPAYVQMIPVDIRDSLRSGGSYDTFEKWVCKLSLRAMMDGYINDLLDYIDTKLNELLALMGTNKIDQWISDYMTTIAPFLSTLDDLQKFADCGFAMCNYVATAQNKEEEISEKISVTRQGSSWAINLNEELNNIIDKEADLRTRIATLQNSIAGQIPRVNNSPSTDDIMRL